MVSMPLAVQSYRHRSIPGSAQRLINGFVEQEPREAKFPLFLLQWPGLIRFATTAGGKVRGLHQFNEFLYVVGDTAIYRLDASAVIVSCGAIPSGGPVSIADNGAQVVVVMPETGQAWVITGTTMAAISDPDFPGASSVTVLDGFGVFSRPDTTQFFLSDLLDLTAYDALQFASAEGSPDNLVRGLRVGRILWLFGEKTIEFWSNTGASPFPFQRISGESIERGCGARDSVAVHELTPFWLGENRLVYRGEGGRATPISTPAMAQAVSGYASVADARGEIIEIESHTFYVLTFPTATADRGATWAYNIGTGLWNEVASEGEVYRGMWRGGAVTRFSGAVIAGDITDGRLYVVDPTAYTEDGDTIVRTFTGVPQHKEGKRLFPTRLMLDMETGVGLASGQGSDPKVWLSISDDGGKTFDHAVMWGDVGRMGKFRCRVEWRRLGAADNVVFQIGFSDPIPITIYAIHLDAEVGED
jgi:hypothetical protein